MNSYRRKSDNTEVTIDEAFDANGAIRDGYCIRTGMIMMDSAGLHRIGSVALNDGYDLTDADNLKIARIEAHNARLSDSWKTPAAVTADHVAAHAAAVASIAPVAHKFTPAPTTDMDTVYDRHDRRLEDAWKMTA